MTHSSHKSSRDSSVIKTQEKKQCTFLWIKWNLNSFVFVQNASSEILLQPFTTSIFCISPVCSILPITAEKSIPFFLPFPNQFLLQHQIQYWSLQPVQKLSLGTLILFPLFSITFRSPRAKTLFFKALLKIFYSQAVTMLWKYSLGRQSLIQSNHCSYKLPYVCVAVNLHFSWQLFTVNALVVAVIEKATQK